LPGPTGTIPRQPRKPFAGQTGQDSLLLSPQERLPQLTPNITAPTSTMNRAWPSASVR